MQISEILMAVVVLALFIMLLFAVYIMAVIAHCDDCPYKSLCNGEHGDGFIPPCQRPQDTSWHKSLYDSFLL